MKKKCSLFLALAMSLALALTGCSSGGAEPSDSPAVPPSGSVQSESTSGYPKSTVQIIVPFSAGGGTDLFARIVADKMSKIMEVPVEVVNKPGGSATIGTTEVSKAAADGYTLGFSISTPLCVTPHFGETSYQFEAFRPICNAYTVFHGIYVTADSPIQNIDDLITYINDNNGVLSYAGSGTGNMQHLCLEEWANQVEQDNWSLTNVPYDGDPEEIVALMSGELPFAVLQVHGAKAAVESGNVRCIMIFGDTTPSWMTDGGYFGPNSVDLGYACNVQGMVGFYGPMDTSDEVVEIVSAAFEQAVQDEAVLESISNIGLAPDFRNTVDYTEALAALVPVSKDLLVQLGFLAS